MRRALGHAQFQLGVQPPYGFGALLKLRHVADDRNGPGSTLRIDQRHAYHLVPANRAVRAGRFNFLVHALAARQYPRAVEQPQRKRVAVHVTITIEQGHALVVGHANELRCTPVDEHDAPLIVGHRDHVGVTIQHLQQKTARFTHGIRRAAGFADIVKHRYALTAARRPIHRSHHFEMHCSALPVYQCQVLRHPGVTPFDNGIDRGATFLVPLLHQISQRQPHELIIHKTKHSHGRGVDIGNPG